jgi:hypothetical protein
MFITKWFKGWNSAGLAQVTVFRCSDLGDLWNAREKCTDMTMKRRHLELVLLLFVTCAARAQVNLLLEEPFGLFGTINPTGHAAIYLPRVCAATPTRLRRCESDEQGAVISRYYGMHGYDWIAIPIFPYLYAVSDAEQIPSEADAHTVARLRDQYRRQYLEEIAPDGPRGQAPRGTWTQLVGAAYDRKIYSFAIESSAQQDRHLIDEFNSRGNHSHFNLFFHNCADFARKVINSYYPKAVRRSFLGDAGMTTPKQIARRLVEYSTRHPELRFTAIVIPQVSGNMGRSKVTRGVFESLMRTKKYAAPLFVLHPLFAGGMLAGYLIAGRFNPDHYADGYYDPREPHRLLGYGGSEASGLVLPQSDDARSQQSHQPPSAELEPSVNHDSIEAQNSWEF